MAKLPPQATVYYHCQPGVKRVAFTCAAAGGFMYHQPLTKVQGQWVAGKKLKSNVQCNALSLIKTAHNFWLLNYCLAGQQPPQ
jgi:hypothetical protein